VTDAQDLCLLPAVELARRLRTRELSARELLTASLARVDAVNPVVNAIVTRDDVRARQRASELDERLMCSGPVGPLHGLPIAHKDLLPTAGLRTTWGSTLYADTLPVKDAVLAARVAAAGAVRLGKTNVPEFGAGSQTTNALFGSTRNPYDPALTPGGSSGGAAAALVTGMVALADGSDMGGSLRNPASFCNVFGLRPTAGRVPNLPARDAWFDLSVLGPMGRCADDAALLLSAITGPDPADPYATVTDGVDFLAPLDRDFTGVRVAWGGPLTPRVARAPPTPSRTAGTTWVQTSTCTSPATSVTVIRGVELGVVLALARGRAVRAPKALGLPFDRQVLEAFDRARPGVEQLGVQLTQAEPDVRGADEVFRVLRGWHLATTIGDAVQAAG